MRAIDHPHRLAALVLFAAVAVPARADDAGRPPDGTLSPTRAFSEQSGESLFLNICRGCHMGDAKGAVGAGAYPALAGNVHLEAGGYPVYVVVNGFRGMPAVGRMMTDAQVAAVVNYVRTHFGNHYADAVTADDVASERP